MIGEYKRYDVVLIDFGENTIGSEQGGIRPAIIIQNNKGNLFSNTTIVMPCTSNIKHLYQPTHALLKRNKENGLPSWMEETELEKDAMVEIIIPDDTR